MVAILWFFYSLCNGTMNDDEILDNLEWKRNGINLNVLWLLAFSRDLIWATFGLCTSELNSADYNIVVTVVSLVMNDNSRYSNVIHDGVVHEFIQGYNWL